MVTTYSLKKDGEKQITPNFKVKEFACHNGDDKVPIDNIVAEWGQKIREHFGVSAIWSSFYRTPDYNHSKDGATSSWHCKGMAGDIVVKGVHPVLVFDYAVNELGVKRAGLYAYSNTSASGFVHIDNGTNGGYLWCTYDPNVKYEQIKGLGALAKGDKGFLVRILQRKLGCPQDGVFGALTENTLSSKWGSKVMTRELWKEMFKI